MNRLTHYLTIIPALMLMILSAGCSHPDSFTITGDIADLESRPVKVVIYNSDSIKTLSAMAVDGRFTLKGSSSRYAIAVLSSMSSGASVRFLVRDGDKIKLNGVSLDSVTVKGSKPNDQIAEFMHDNHELFGGFYPSSSSYSTPSLGYAAANKAIVDYVEKHGTTAAAAFLVAAYYNPTLNPSEAASLLNRFDTDDETRALVSSMNDAVRNELNASKSARIHSFNLPAAGDSTVKFSPSAQSYTLLAFTSSDTGRKRKEITSILHDASDRYPRRSLRVIELSLCGDSSSWKSAIKQDTLVNWSRILLPGGAAALQVRHLNIGQVPYYILADSTGKQLYRGNVVSAAMDSLHKKLR